MGRGETLGRGSEYLFEFSAEVRFISKLQLIGSRFIGVTLRNKILRQPTLQLPQPMARGTMQVLPEQPLQLTLRNGTKRGHLRRVEISLPRDLFPLLDCQEAPIHIHSL